MVVVSPGEEYWQPRNRPWLPPAAPLAPSRHQGAPPVEEPSVVLTLRTCPAPPPLLALPPQAPRAVRCSGGPSPAHGDRHLHVTVPCPEPATPPPCGGTSTLTMAFHGTR